MNDLIIIGAGPAGLTASIYASCYQLKHLVIGKVLGGQLNNAPHILNYPGFATIDGKELTQKMLAQTRQYGAQILEDEVIKIVRDDQGNFTVVSKNNGEYQAKSLILASGTERQKLNVPGEMQYSGKGVYYCVNCEPFVFENKDVVIVGGGNSAFQAANKVIDKAKSVTIYIRSEQIRAEEVWFSQLKNNPKFKIMLKTKIKEIKGDGSRVQKLIIEENGAEKSYSAEVLFIEIGGIPGTALFAPLGINLDEKGFVKVNEIMQTSVKGVFAAGDIVGSNLSLEQISTAVGLGARAAASAFNYLRHERAPVVWGKAKIKRI